MINSTSLRKYNDQGVWQLVVRGPGAVFLTWKFLKLKNLLKVADKRGISFKFGKKQNPAQLGHEKDIYSPRYATWKMGAGGS